MRLLPAISVVAVLLSAGPARAVQVCELNGQHVNPNNGNTTQGKTGLMRCRDGEGGPVVREQELQNGVFMGIARWYEDGVLRREQSVNAKGNRDGVAREYAKAPGGGKPVLVREETYRDGTTVGLARTWYPSGALRRVSFHGDDRREQASAEFNEQGQLTELQCAARPLLGGGKEGDDARWCGHAGEASNVVLYNARGVARTRVSYERGERRKREALDDKGTVRDQWEATASGGFERQFAADGVKRREIQWVNVNAGAGGEQTRRVVTLEQEFHESGKLVKETRRRPSERGSELQSEQTWYLNGQPKAKSEFAVVGSGSEARTVRRETTWHDNGAKSFEGEWSTTTLVARRFDERPVGVHRSFDENGRVRFERFHDERGKLVRERELDASGVAVRDDEVYEDGSRKSIGPRATNKGQTT